MSQQINLINPALIKQKDLLTPVNIGVVYSLLIGAMLFWYIEAQQSVSRLLIQQHQLDATLTTQQTLLTQMTADRVPRAPDAALEAQWIALEDKHAMQQLMIDTLVHNKPSLDKGLDSYMRGLAKQTLEGIWLTGFLIDQQKRSVTLQGKSLQADNLPAYMQKLGEEPVFKGQSFSGLLVKSPVDSTSPTAPTTLAADALNTGKLQAPQTAQQQGQQSLAPYVEFELKGLEDATVMAEKGHST
jgi:hypothetical protein